MIFNDFLDITSKTCATKEKQTETASNLKASAQQRK
jgi:hypothetical protein